MKNYLPKSLTRFVVRSLLVLLGIVLVITLLANSVLWARKNELFKGLNQKSAYQVSASRLYFVFPNIVLIKDLKLVYGGKILFIVPTSATNFSLLSLFQKNQLVLRNIAINTPRLDQEEVNRFLQSDLSHFVRFLRELPKENINIKLQQGVLSSSYPGNPNYVLESASFNLDDNTIKATATWYQSKKMLENSLFEPEKEMQQAQFQGTLTDTGFSLRRLSFQNPKLYVSLWGDVLSNTAHLNGYAFVNSAPEPVFRRIENPFRHLNPFFALPNAQPAPLSRPNIVILNIDSQLKFQWPKIEMPYLNFEFNDLLVELKGAGAVDKNGSPFALSGEIFSAALGQRPKFKQADFALKGSLQPNSVTTDGTLNLYFTKAEDSNLSLERIKTDFEDFRITLSRFARLNIHSNTVDLRYWTNGNEHKIFFSDLKAFYNPVAGGLKFLRIYSQFYGGLLEGKAWVNIAKTPITINSQFLLKDCLSNRLGELLVHFSKIEGRLNSHLTLNKDPEFSLKGTLDIHDGRLNNFDFFVWMAETFAAPSVKQLKFQKLQTAFLVNKAGAHLTDIGLASDEVRVSGFFNVDKDNFVSSKLNLIFSRGLMYSSPKLRAILKMFDRETQSVDFDFQLSGGHDALNFQWLDSESKRRIQKRIPNFIERIIERRIDASMEEEEKKPNRFD